jgi:hypothetical protein
VNISWNARARLGPYFKHNSAMISVSLMV